MAGEQIAARRRSPHPPRRAGRSATGAHARAGSSTELSRQRPSRVLEKVSELLLEEVAERFQLGSPPPAAGSP
jgi:hypothetical protein